MTDRGQRRFVLRLQYDGSDFHGWQYQPDTVTVQSTLDGVLSRLFDRPTRSAAAGRTDRGVHATGQVVTCDGPETWAPAELERATNALLPDRIRVTSVRTAPPDFHARFSAIARAYVYRVGVHPEAASPFLNRYCWPLCEPLDGGSLERAAAAIEGEHSFAGFAKSGQEDRGHRCRVLRARWRDWDGLGFRFRILADRFLHHMVRYLVGTMVAVSRGTRPESDIEALLAGEPDAVTSPPAPPGGLFLAHVYYEAGELDPYEEPDDTGSEHGQRLPIP